jgi:ubiquinone/menaquinone biosynthesis C-methylase UbiE
MQPLPNGVDSTCAQTRRADSVIVNTVAELLPVTAQGTYLDLACGTGHYTVALAEIAGKWHGVDPSEDKIKQAKARSSSINWRWSSADALPYANDFFDGAVCTLALHHFADLQRSFKEIYRVLHQGQLVLFTSFPKQMRGYWLCRYFPNMMKSAIAQMPTEVMVCTALNSAGFKVEKIIPFLVTHEVHDVFLYAGKERPELYFDPEIRANIPSFASRCKIEELMNGLQHLKRDILSGKFSQVAESCRVGQADYAYIVARKSVE